MSLEWARARLLQHRETLRKLCEAQAAARVAERAAQRRRTVVTLRPEPLQHPLTDARDSGTVLKFGQRGRRRRA